MCMENRHQPTILKLIVNKLSRHERAVCFYSAVIFPVEVNLSSIIDKFILFRYNVFEVILP